MDFEGDSFDIMNHCKFLAALIENYREKMYIRNRNDKIKHYWQSCGVS